jgi:hypothetical protein
MDIRWLDGSGIASVKYDPQFLTIMVCYLVAFFLLSMVLGYIVGRGKY